MKNQNQSLPPDVSEELRTYLEQIPRVTEADLAELRQAAQQLDKDPAFQADYLKGLFVEKVLAAMSESGETQSQLAQRWGKSRQYVSKLLNEDKRVNFTLETMSSLAHLLGLRIDLQVLRPGEVSYVIRCHSAKRVVTKPEWSQPPEPSQSMDNVTVLFGIPADGCKNVNSKAYDPDLAA